MGIFNSLKSEVQRQFIARPDDEKDTIIYKWPERNIRKYSQLTVQQDEVALFVKKGEVVGSLGAGTHNLDGADIPFIGILIDAATDGNFLMSELYFVSTRQFTSLPFGGMIDNVIDPTTKLAVGIRLFGEYSVKAIDSEALIVNLAGTKDLETNEELVDWVKEQLLKNFREVVSSYVSEQNKPILGIASQASEFEAKVLELVQRDLEEYGLEIPKLGNVTISIKEEDEETLKQMTRDFAYANNAAAADVAMKLGMAEGLKKGGAGADAAQVSAGVATGMGIAAGMSAASNAQSGSDKPKDEDTDNTDK